ncbi:MAG: hypothetical protein AAF663_10490, partial [Planctomycetota bacterium]
LARVPLAAEAFTDLRSARVAATAAYLTSEAGLPSSRVRVSDAPAEPDDSESIETPRVVFEPLAD